MIFSYLWIHVIQPQLGGCDHTPLPRVHLQLMVALDQHRSSHTATGREVHWNQLKRFEILWKTLKPNWHLCRNLSLIWRTTNMCTSICYVSRVYSFSFYQLISPLFDIQRICWSSQEPQREECFLTKLRKFL